MNTFVGSEEKGYVFILKIQQPSVYTFQYYNLDV